MRGPRRLTPEETAIWRKVADTVTPIEKRRVKPQADVEAITSPPLSVPPPASPPLKRKAASVHRPLLSAPVPQVRPVTDPVGLDSSWERRIAKGTLQPDFALDLHGAGLDAAYVRLMHGLTQAKSLGARVVLIVTGKPRPVEAADRGRARGAIRAKITDWLAASEHAADIAAIRGAHRRHGGQGALYVVLKRRR